MIEKQKIVLHLREALDLTTIAIDELDSEKVSWGDLKMAIEDAAAELSHAEALASAASKAREEE